MVEGGDIKKFPQGDVQPVAQFLDGGDGGAVVAPADDVVDGGLGHAAEGGQPVDSDPTLGAKLQDPRPDRCIGGDSASHPNSKEII